jgi:hypothetical protein
MRGGLPCCVMELLYLRASEDCLDEIADSNRKYLT